MKRIRLTLVLAVSSFLTIAPVVSPVWASPQPVKPTLHTVALTGVDQASLATSPPAFDPKAVRAARASASPGATPPTPSARVARTTRPAVLSPELKTADYTAAGVSWAAAKAPADVVVQVRVLENGRWGDWQPLETASGPDANTQEAKNAAARVSTEPIVTPAGQGVQVRVDSSTNAAPADLKLLTVDAGTSAADANLQGTPAATAQSATTRPSILTRAQWGADESLLNAHGPCPGYSPTVKVGFVHHTVSTNSYTPAQSASLVRGIYAYHVNGNGWCDIGYNFLVDRFGNIFEGRHGGMDRAVLGAHTLAFNYNSFGVAAIGTFSTTSTPQPMLTSIGNVLGWKLGTFGRNPRGTQVLRSAGGAGAKWPTGTMITFNTVSGHRDAYSTECPGNVLYGQLPNLRGVAATWIAGHTTRDENLYGVWGTTGWSPAGKVEIHAQSKSSAWQSRMLDVATSWSAGKATDWRFFVGSASGDTRPDLIGVHAFGTASGHVEVKVASWASGYRDTIIQTVTPAGAFKPDVTTQLSVGGPSGGDLYILELNSTRSGTVEVHRLSAASNYSQWSLNSTSRLSGNYGASGNRFFVARGTGDLYYVMHSNTASHHSEVYALSAASNFRTYLWRAATPIGYTSDTNSQWLIGTNGIPDLMWAQVNGTASKRVEMHSLSPYSQYGRWQIGAVTSLPALNYPVWQLSMG